jgi:apolipoprotein N-acyltransferase
VDILLGSTQVERGTPPRYFNSAFLVGTDGEQKSVYRKMRLVPFGEYVPLKSLLFFAGPLVEAVSDFTPGTEATILPIAGGQASTAICYEIVFPNLVRRFVADGSQLLTTITNDAWYGYSSAPYQHFAQASMRAIEQGRILFAPPIPASAASSTHTDASSREASSSPRRSSSATCSSCAHRRRIRGSGTRLRTPRWR